MWYTCYFQAEDLGEVTKKIENPNFDILRARIEPKFMYAVAITEPVQIRKDTKVDQHNLFWPKHARGRKLLKLSCGHIVYADMGVTPEVCFICKRPIWDERCFYCDGPVVPYVGNWGHVWCDNCKTDYEPETDKPMPEPEAL
jgi:hypothetical protein